MDLSLEGGNSMELQPDEVRAQLADFYSSLAGNQEYHTFIWRVQRNPVRLPETPRNKIDYFDVEEAYIYIGRVLNLDVHEGSVKHDHEHKTIEPIVHISFERSFITHEKTLELRLGYVELPLLSFDQYSFSSNPKNGFRSPGVYVLNGYANTEHFLRNLGFEGEMSKDIPTLYRDMEKQNNSMEKNAIDYFNLPELL